MKSLLLPVTILLLCAAPAAAEMLLPVEATGPVAFSAALDNSHPTYDRITLQVTAIGGDPYSTDFVTGFCGMWSVTGGVGTGFYLPGTASKWQLYTSSSWQDFSDPPESTESTGFNFTSYTGKLFDGSTPAFRTPVSGDVYRAFGNTWYSADPQIYLRVGDVFGVLWVTKNWLEIALGDYNSSNPSKVGLHGGGYFETLRIVIPEPSTLVLLTAALVGLLCYAWRKRR